MVHVLLDDDYYCSRVDMTDRLRAAVLFVDVKYAYCAAPSRLQLPSQRSSCVCISKEFCSLTFVRWYCAVVQVYKIQYLCEYTVDLGHSCTRTNEPILLMAPNYTLSS